MKTHKNSHIFFFSIYFNMYKHPEQVEYMNDKQKGNVNQLSTSGWCLHAASKYCTKQSTFTEHCSNLAVPNLQLSQWLQLTWAGLHVDVHRLMITGSHRPAKHCRLCQGKSTASNSKHTHNLLSKEDESVKLAFSLSLSFNWRWGDRVDKNTGVEIKELQVWTPNLGIKRPPDPPPWWTHCLVLWMRWKNSSTVHCR